MATRRHSNHRGSSRRTSSTRSTENTPRQIPRLKPKTTIAIYDFDRKEIETLIETLRTQIRSKRFQTMRSRITIGKRTAAELVAA